MIRALGLHSKSLFLLIQQSAKYAMKSDFSHKKEFSISIICRKHADINDEAIGQTVGCFIDARYLDGEQHIDEQFRNFTRRLCDINKKGIGNLGFEIHFVLKNSDLEPDGRRVMEFKQRLILCGISEKSISVDFVKDEKRLIDVPKRRLLNIAFTSDI